MVEKDYEWEIQYRDEQIKELKEALQGTIREEGRLKSKFVDGVLGCKWEINTSSILTKLIQEAGRWCESYASDLFIQWNEDIEKKLQNGTFESGTCVFAMWNGGVDGNTFYEKRKNSSHDYRAVWFIDVIVSNSSNKMEMVLHK